jgi:hypothetical protein
LCGHRGRRPAVGPNAVEKQGQVAAIQVRRESAREVRDTGQRHLDEEQVRLIEISPDSALLLGSLHEGGHQRRDAIPRLVDPRVAKLGAVHDLGQAPVTELHVQCPFEERDEAVPGLGVIKRLVSNRDDFIEALVKQRFDDFLLVGEAPVRGADTHAGAVSDVVQRNAETLLGKQLTRRGKQALSIERRVLTEWCPRHDPSLTEADTRYPVVSYGWGHKRIGKIRLGKRYQAPFSSKSRMSSRQDGPVITTAIPNFKAIKATSRDARTSPALTLVVALLGFFVVTFDAVVVNVTLPTIRHDLGGGITGLQWVADGYTLLFAALLLTAGALSDRVGARRAFGTGMAVFIVASALCGLSVSLPMLVAARFLQGAAAAVMMPSSMALIREAYPSGTQRARALAT